MSTLVPSQDNHSISAVLRNSLIGIHPDQQAGVTLSVRFVERDVNLRELGSYLLLIDRFYARIASQSVYQYAHRRDEQLSVSEIVHGSCQLLLRETVGPGHSSVLAPLYLLLRHLGGIASVTRLLVDYHQQGEDYSSVGTTRGIRKALRMTLPADPVLGDLDRKTHERLVEFLQRVYSSEAKHLAPALRFDRNYVRGVDLTVIRSQGDDHFPLRGTVLSYENPTEPIDEKEWSILG